MVGRPFVLCVYSLMEVADVKKREKKKPFYNLSRDMIDLIILSY